MEDMHYRVRKRIVGNIAGVICFTAVSYTHLNLMMMYRCAIREIQTKLEVLDDEFSVENNRNPISFIKMCIRDRN